MKVKKSLFIATSSFGINKKSTLDLLKRNKINFKSNPLKRKLNAEELVRLAKNNTHILAGTEIYDKKVLNHLKKLKFIFRLGSGTENLDVKELKKRKIKIIKSKVTPEIAVAELIVGMSLSLLRDLHRHNSNMKNKIWIKKMGNTIQNKKFGIIGYGKVGRCLAKILKGMGVKLFINDKIKFKLQNFKSLDYLLSKSDIIAICMNSDGKKCFLNKNKIKKIKKDAILINTSRANLIDNNYLYSVLKSNKNFKAALDVFDKEPYFGKFCKLDNTLLTPHIAGYAKEIREKMEQEAIYRIIKEIKNES